MWQLCGSHGTFVLEKLGLHRWSRHNIVHSELQHECDAMAYVRISEEAIEVSIVGLSGCLLVWSMAAMFGFCVLGSSSGSCEAWQAFASTLTKLAELAEPIPFQGTHRSISFETNRARAAKFPWAACTLCLSQNLDRVQKALTMPQGSVPVFLRLRVAGGVVGRGVELRSVHFCSRPAGKCNVTVCFQRNPPPTVRSAAA